VTGGGVFKQEWQEPVAEPLVTAYYFRQWEEFDMPFHGHDSVEIMYAISGVCRVEVLKNGQKLHIVELKKGEFIILDGNVQHRLIVDKHTPCRMLNIEFRISQGISHFPSISKLARQDADLQALLEAQEPYYVFKDSNEVYHTLKLLVLELDAGSKETPGAMAGLLFQQLLIQIARIYRQFAFSGSRQLDLYMNQCLQFIHHNYDRDIQVKDIAAAVNLHHGYLHRIFRARVGQSITAYLTGLRLEKAKMLLRQTDIPIMDICDYIGVGSRQYFHAMFKKLTGLTPVQYRTRTSTGEENDESGYYIE
jgi:AraC-like DNA-binding protein